MSVSIKAPDENPSNIESILSDTIGLPGYTINPPGSRIEELLIELNELIKSGGGGGGSDTYATNLSLTIDSSTYIITAVLKNKDGESIGTPQIIDLPMESVVVSGSYNSQTKKVVLTLQNGSTIEFSVADLVNGLQTEITSTNKLDADLVDDSTSTNKFVTSADKSAWNSKQNALVVGTNLDDVPTEDSTNPITSGGVYNTVGNLDAALDSLIMSLEPKTITANGVYDSTDDGVDGYSMVTVNVPSGNANFVYNSSTGVNFSQRSALESIEIPEGYRAIASDSFLNCSNLKTVNFATSVTTIGSGAFKNCTSLTSMEIPSSITQIEYNSFSGCTNLTTITVNKPTGSISDAPWGATNATVVWTG